MFEDLARNLEVPHALGMTTVLVVPPATREVFREDWELEGRDAAHVDHVTDDLAGFLRKIAGLDGAVPRPGQNWHARLAARRAHVACRARQDHRRRLREARRHQPATKGPVREAVERALDLLDRGKARVAERGGNGAWTSTSG